jgi:hypothetical protein
VSALELLSTGVLGAVALFIAWFSFYVVYKLYRSHS